MDKIKFEAGSWEDCTAKMKELCNDGRCWTVYEVFGLVTATAHATPRNVPRAAVDTLRDAETLYWQNGQWHKRKPATAAMERAEQARADRASGVSDGGGDPMQEFKRWARRMKKRRQ